LLLLFSFLEHHNDRYFISPLLKIKPKIDNYRALTKIPLTIENSPLFVYTQLPLVSVTNPQLKPENNGA